jgi:hypothetical protein
MKTGSLCAAILSLALLASCGSIQSSSDGGGASGGSAGHAGTGGATGGAGRAGTGGATGTGGLGEGGSGGAGAKAGAGGATGTGGSPDAGTISCVRDGGDCPAGYRCGCGGPGIGACTCHKECTSDSDCSAPNTMCGCSATDPARICVNACFCLCG